jgi:hypothetical protein
MNICTKDDLGLNSLPFVYGKVWLQPYLALNDVS